MMRDMSGKIKHFKRVVYVASFIARKNIQRGSKAVKLVTVSILMLTFFLTHHHQDINCVKRKNVKKVEIPGANQQVC
jgi:hypothetical protein